MDTEGSQEGVKKVLNVSKRILKTLKKAVYPPIRGFTEAAPQIIARELEAKKPIISREGAKIPLDKIHEEVKRSLNEIASLLRSLDE